MSTDLLEWIKHDLCKVGDELWNIDGADDALDEVLKQISLLKVQLEVQKSLQATANVLRKQRDEKALPKQQATKVKHFIRFVFRKQSHGGRYRQLRKLDCDALKFCGLSYTIEEIVKLGDAELEILQNRITEFIHYRNLSYLLYRPDVDKAVDTKLEDPEDDVSFDKFMQSHATRRLSTRKRKYDTIASPNEVVQGQFTIFPSRLLVVNISIAPANNQDADDDKARPSQGALHLLKNRRQLIVKESGEVVIANVDVFAITKDDARYAMSSDQDQDIQSIFLTGTSFLTVWVSEDIGKSLGERGRKLDYKYRGFTEGLRRNI